MFAGSFYDDKAMILAGTGTNAEPVHGVAVGKVFCPYGMG